MAAMIESLLPLGVMIIVAAVVIARRFVTLRRVRVNHTQVAQRFRGRVIGSDWKRPYTEFYIGGERVVVSIFRDRSEGVFATRSTHVHIAWPHPPTWLYLRPRTVLLDFFGWMDGTLVAPGNEWFRQRFRVRAPDQRATRDLLTPAVQRHLYDLLNFAHSERFTLSIANGLMQVRVAGALDESGELLAFVEEVVAFHTAAVAAFQAGIEFAAADTARLPLAEGATCQICGDKIEHELVVCATCHTPHHRECWQYNGQCAIFGCRETHFTSAPAGRKEGIANR